MAQAGQPTTTNKEEGTAVHSNGRDRGSEVIVAARWQDRGGRSKQTGRINNINECASCTTLARCRPGRQDGNECLKAAGESQRRWAAKTLLNTYVCQAPSLQVSALASLAKQPQCAAIHSNHPQQPSTATNRCRWRSHGVDEATPSQ